MKISYDYEVDALYIRLLDGPQQCRTVRLSDEVALNMGEGEQLVGIEVLAAKRVLRSGQLPRLSGKYCAGYGSVEMKITPSPARDQTRYL